MGVVHLVTFILEGLGTEFFTFCLVFLEGFVKWEFFFVKSLGHWIAEKSFKSYFLCRYNEYLLRGIKFKLHNPLYISFTLNRRVNSFRTAGLIPTSWMWQLSLRTFKIPRTWNNIKKVNFKTLPVN